MNILEQAKEITSKVSIGMRKNQVVDILGEPDDISIYKRNRPFVYKYKDVELHFDKGENPKLWMIYAEDENHNPIFSLRI